MTASGNNQRVWDGRWVYFLARKALGAFRATGNILADVLKYFPCSPCNKGMRKPKRVMILIYYSFQSGVLPRNVSLKKNVGDHLDLRAVSEPRAPAPAADPSKQIEFELIVAAETGILGT